MIRRILGLETEYAVSNLVTIDGVKQQCGEEAAKLIPPNSGDYSSGFTENGSRFYMDINSHPEYATPECLLLLDLVAADKAGEKVVDRRRQLVDSELKFIGGPNTHIYKINTDSKGTTFGCHENYLVSRDHFTGFEALEESLLPHLFSRIVYAGAGRFYPDKGFSISQRAEHMMSAVGGSTTSNRGAINTRDEPHSTREDYRRLHIICGDANMSEYAIFLKMGTTSLILTLIEEGLLGSGFALAKPIEALQTFSRDLGMRQRVELKDGGTGSALELQRRYLEVVKYHLSGVSSDHDMVMEVWEDILARLSRGIKEVRTRVDWCAKYLEMREYKETRGLSFSHPRVAAIDLTYHDISDQGLYNHLVRKGRFETLVDPSLIELRTREAPQTRAFLRGEFIRWCFKHHKSWSADWMALHVRGPEGKGMTFSAHLPNPFNNRHEFVERILKS